MELLCTDVDAHSVICEGLIGLSYITYITTSHVFMFLQNVLIHY